MTVVVLVVLNLHTTANINTTMGDSGEPQIISMKMKTFDEDRVKNELISMEDKSSSEDRDSPDSSRQSRFSGRFHRRSIRRGSKYKMTHRSPTELMKVKKVRRAKANDRERMRMQTLNQVELHRECFEPLSNFRVTLIKTQN